MVILLVAALWLLSSAIAFYAGTLRTKIKNDAIAYKRGYEDGTLRSKTLIRTAYKMGYIKGKDERRAVQPQS